MMRGFKCCFFVFVVVITACTDFNSNDVENILSKEKIYPQTIEQKLFCDNEPTAKQVIESNMIENGFVIAQLRHTSQDLGMPLISFTSKAEPYLLPTDDTLKSVYIQRIKIADEVFLEVNNIEISPAGTRAVVDYSTSIVNLTPFAVLYKQDVRGAKKRRTFFTKENDQWTWDGKVIKMDR